MDTFRQHEQFEIEVLDKLRNLRLLQPIVFGGGTMLRLCHDLNRYSADLDFWFVKPVDQEAYFAQFRQLVEGSIELTDAQMEHYTLLFELRSSAYPKRLKIEIRRELLDIDFQEKIAYSKFANRQVVLKALTLEQAMNNKVAAFIDRGEIRDGFDIEFLLRKGIPLPKLEPDKRRKIAQSIDRLKDLDFRVKLGSILEKEVREYYIEQKFSFLEEKLEAM
jgi:predicted nucleotidyltransferase component of viral defense system